MRRALPLLALVAGCHLALGLEEAVEIETGGECTEAAECNDQNPCTEDACDAGVCHYTSLDGEAPASAQQPGDCVHAVCAQGTLTSTTDASDVPVDGRACTDDVCNGNQPQNPPLAGGAACNEDGGQVCDGSGNCVECFSNAECSAPETCGGGGPPNQCGCTPTMTCSTVGLTCGGGGTDDCNHPIVCSNGMMDGTETDVDCGGPQPPSGTCAILCPAGKACDGNLDCVSGDCQGNICQ
ncbi:MAG: hypothetical protein KC731_02315 [Myxococcales bacterium]|nr:hypothetical protein [Myxococcales bacterium]